MLHRPIFIAVLILFNVLYKTPTSQRMDLQNSIHNIYMKYLKTLMQNCNQLLIKKSLTKENSFK